jgi:hypothetical protein
MNPERKHDLYIDPATVLLGLGYATGLLVVIGWVACCFG